MANVFQRLAAIERTRKAVENSILSEHAKNKLLAELAAQLAALDAEVSHAGSGGSPSGASAAPKGPGRA